jgi:hypothetical protein
MLIIPPLPAESQAVVIDCRRVDAGNIKGTATLMVRGIEIRGVRIIQQPGASAWVSMPCGKDKRGRWFALVALPHKLREQASQAVLRAWRSL